MSEGVLFQFLRCLYLKKLTWISEEVIRRRLLIDGDGTGDDRRLNVLIKSIIKWSYATEESPTEKQISFDKMLSQLCQCEFALKRSLLLNQTNEKQMQNYKTLQCKLEEKIKEVKVAIEESKNNLSQAKVLKQNRMMYDLMAQSIEKHPARKVTNECLENLKSELQELHDEQKRLEEKLDLKRKQFFVLVSSANSLRAMLEEMNDDVEMNQSLDDITNSPGPEPMSE